MDDFRIFATRFLLTLTLSLAILAKAFAGDVITVEVGQNQSELINLPQDMTSVVIADRAIGGVVKHSPRKVSVIGHNVGKTDIRFMNGNRIVRQVNLVVGQDLPAVKKSLKSFFPRDNIGVESVNGAIALTGSVSDAETAAQVVKIVKEYTGDESKIINLMKLKSGQQVMLRVRVGELRRDTIKKLGLGLHGIISSGSAVLGALERDGAFKILAEPTLTAISGETAQFLAGGEFPIPVVQAGNTMSVDYKSFGVSVNFTPLVLSENRIRLDVASEVSELSDIGAKTVSSMTIPAINTRRANTTVEMAPGESFMIAGLMKDNSGANIHKVPGLGDIPILSPLFRSAEFQRNETELVVAVTPYLADPVTGEEIHMPGENFEHASMLRMLFLGALSADNSASKNQNSGLEGQAGYAIE